MQEPHRLLYGNEIWCHVMQVLCVIYVLIWEAHQINLFWIKLLARSSQRCYAVLVFHCTVRATSKVTRMLFYDIPARPGSGSGHQRRTKNMPYAVLLHNKLYGLFWNFITGAARASDRNVSKLKSNITKTEVVSQGNWIWFSWLSTHLCYCVKSEWRTYEWSLFPVGACAILRWVCPAHYRQGRQVPGGKNPRRGERAIECCQKQERW